VEAYRDPIKHYVRKYGWLPKAQERLQELRRARSGVCLRYFTLCGPDIIDVKFLAMNGVLRHDERGYPDVAFCESSGEHYTDAISNLGRPMVGFNRSFEDVVLNDRLSKYYPFDVYNLDFSRSCFPNEEPPTSRTMVAVQRLIEGQAAKSRAFDLFFTFRAESGRENQGALASLGDYMKRNLDEDEALLQTFKEKYHVEIEVLMRKDYLNFILLTFPKLIAFFGQDHGFAMTDLRRFWYTRTYTDRFSGLGIRYFIMKFIFSFDMVRAGRRVERAERRTERLRQNYMEIAKKSIREPSVDVRQMITNDDKQALKEEVRSLLGSQEIQS
jgi:hypothetical protein